MTAFRFTPKRQKYGNAMAGGSKLEEAVYGLLLLREQAGKIRNLRRQVPLVLQDGPREMKITWRVDFAFEEPDEEKNKARNTNVFMRDAYAEAKGFANDVYPLKLKLFRKARVVDGKFGPLEIYGGTYTRPYVIERIE